MRGVQWRASPYDRRNSYYQLLCILSHYKNLKHSLLCECITSVVTSGTCSHSDGKKSFCDWINSFIFGWYRLHDSQLLYIDFVHGLRTLSVNALIMHCTKHLLHNLYTTVIHQCIWPINRLIIRLNIFLSRDDVIWWINWLHVHGRMNKLCNDWTMNNKIGYRIGFVWLLNRFVEWSAASMFVY